MTLNSRTPKALQELPGGVQKDHQERWSTQPFARPFQQLSVARGQLGSLANPAGCLAVTAGLEASLRAEAEVGGGRGPAPAGGCMASGASSAACGPPSGPRGRAAVCMTPWRWVLSHEVLLLPLQPPTCFPPTAHSTALLPSPPPLSNLRGPCSGCGPTVARSKQQQLWLVMSRAEAARRQARKWRTRGGGGRAGLPIPRAALAGIEDG